MKTKKLKGFTYSDREPRAGDTMICIRSESVNFGELSTATPALVKVGAVDTINWKVVENMEDRKQLIVDEVIVRLKEDIRLGDLTVLDELLKLMPIANLVQSLPEEEWDRFPESKLKNV